jgi:hypothetical protein
LTRDGDLRDVRSHFPATPPASRTLLVMRGRPSIAQRLRRGLTRRKMSRRMFQYYKEIYHRLGRGAEAAAKTTVLILGCQRSGTTLMHEIFAADLHSKVYSEFSQLTAHWDGVNREQKIRLNALDTVARDLERNAAPLKVVKPIVESQHADRLLSHFSRCKVLWMFRHYEEVVASDLKKFGLGNGIENLRPIAEGQPDNWRSERVPPAVRRLVRSRFSHGMSPYDAAALFWYVRNQFVFELSLESDPRVLLVPYQQLAIDPASTMRQVYEFVGRGFPGNHIFKHVHAGSLGKGGRVELSPEVRRLCDGLLRKLGRASGSSHACA